MSATEFIHAQDVERRGSLRVASIFSGAGLSDVGYRRAGFDVVAQAELDERRAEIGSANFETARWIVGDITEKLSHFEVACGSHVDLLSVTPPCQGLSSSNPSRGRWKSDVPKDRNFKRNTLLLRVLPMMLRLSPRVFVVENVRQILTFPVRHSHQKAGASLLDVVQRRMSDYAVFATVINTADYGIPQARLRAVVVGVRKDEPWLSLMVGANALPWPRSTHSALGSPGRSWVTIAAWLKSQGYEPLDARSLETAIGTHPLHRVPVYDDDRYFQVSSIPPNSGRSAYENESCPTCGSSPVAVGRAYCPVCRGPMWNRPYVQRRGGFRLIRGFHSSYRRMQPDAPAPPVMTSSGRVGSDHKIHPFENRVLSVLECADLQTIPRSYDWSGAVMTGRFGLIREAIGEALPPYFTFLHGTLLGRLMSGDTEALDSCELRDSTRNVIVRRTTVSRSQKLTGRANERRSREI